MNAEELLSYLGHASVEPALDDYLTGAGIDGRPSKNENTVYVDSDDGKLTLTFQAYDVYKKESLVLPKNEGKFIFQTATFKRGFQDAFPYGLGFDAAPDAVTDVLGQPGRARKLPNGEQSITYFHGGCLVVVRFSASGHGIDWLSVGVPNTYNKEQGVAD
jgi:hypothetical protein